MMKTRLLGALACLAFSCISLGADFTNADLKKIVDELEVHLPKNPDVVYPIQATVEKSDDINAYATVKEIAGQKDKFQGVMVVYSGLVDFAKGDIRLIRAVVAHELAHLSKGHMFRGMRVQDVDLLYTRQMEYEADLIGAAALVRAGYPKKDMYDMLLMLDQLDSKSRAADKLMGDHAEAKRRAIQVAENPSVLRSYLSFEMGEAYADCRSYASAMKAFDKTLEKEPKFKEAAVNSALAALQMYYYQGLPKSYQETYFRPDFGALLKAPPVSRLIKIDAQAYKLYAEALKRIKRAQDLAPTDVRVIELAGLASVLNPDESTQAVADGVTQLRKALDMSIMPADKLRIANNIALGLQIQKNVVGAVEQMMAVQRTTNLYNAALAQNLGQQELPEKLKADAGLAAGVMITYLNNSPEGNPVLYNRVKENYLLVCKKYNFKAKEVTPKPTYLCKTLSLFDNGNEYRVLGDPLEFIQQLGKPDKKFLFDKDYPGLYELVFQGGNFTALVEEAGEAIVLRVTSYNNGAYVAVQPRDPSAQAFNITVGMTTAQFENYLSLSSGQKRSFIRAGTIEEWIYYPSLYLGVCVKDNKIVGVTCTPSSKP